MNADRVDLESVIGVRQDFYFLADPLSLLILKVIVYGKLGDGVDLSI